MWHTAGTRRTQGHQSHKTTILTFTATGPQVSLVALMSDTDPAVNVKPHHKHCNVSRELYVRQLCHVNIQGDSGGICTTLRNDSMSDSKQKSSYEHGSDFERLQSYDRLKLGIEGNNY